MSQQIQITGGAKVRDLQDVIIGTSGVLSSVAFDVANGVPRLDSNGKILVSQLPNSVMEYKGVWNAATNTPTLANGTGNQGDVYLCNVAGTVNFGAGPISFIVGDSAVYSGSIWQRSGGATGSVTSVGLSTNGGAITIGSSPITTSGTITANFNGTNLEYVNGAGNLTTFPTLITSVGLTMPSAFTVTNSPLTGAGGTLAVTGAGTTAQYIRGDGSLATFPTIASEAQRLITEVYNSTGATLTKGTVVYINGGQGNLPTVTKAIATGDATSAQTYGVVQTDITNMNNGYVVVIGSLMDLDTQAYPNGTQLYLSSTVAGQWTSVKQYAPAHLVYVAIVTRSHPTQGVVEVRIQNGFEMDELHNVSAQTPSNNQGLFYNTSTSLWENKSIATALGYTPADDSLVVKLAGTQTITGAKTFSGAVTLTSSVTTNNITFANSGFFLTLQPPTLSVNRTVTLPNGTGTIALTSDISYPVTSVFGRTGAVVATSGDYTTAQVTESGNLYFTDSRARLALSFVAGSGAYNSTTGVITIPTDNSQIANGAGYITSSALSGYVTLAGTETITGAKTFSTFTKFDGGVILKNNVSASLAGYVGLSAYSASGNKGINIDFDTYSNSFYFSGTLPYQYTFPAASGTIALVGGSGVGTVTSVAALTIGTSGTDLSSSVANSTTTPVITLNVPTASAANRGALSSADWTTFNSKQGTITLTTTGTSGAATFSSNTLNIPQYQSALTNPVTGTGTTNYLPKFTGASTIGNSLVYDNGTNVIIGGTTVPDSGLKTYVTNGTVGLGNYLSSTIGYIGTWTNHSLGFAINGSSKMLLDTSGNLGLGVTPTGKLHIALPTYSNEDTDSQQAIFGVASGYGVRIGYNEAGNYGVINSLKPAVAWGNLVFQSGGGNVLIGTTTDSGYKLDVNGTGRFSGQVRFGTGLYIDTNGDFYQPFTGQIQISGVAGNTTYPSYGFYGDTGLGMYRESADTLAFVTSAVKRLTIASTGAATFSSSVSLNAVFNSTTNTPYIRFDESSNAKFFIGQRGAVSGDGGTGYDLYTVAGNDLRFFAGATKALTLATTGAATFSSSVTATGFFESSDSRLKTLIKDNYQTKGIASITPKLYTKNGKVELGYYAQDFVGILDSAVSKGSDDMLSLSYREVHTAKIYALEQEIKELKAKMN